MNTKLFDRIRSLGKLTASESKITALFEENPNGIAFETVTSIAKKTGVSKASVVRFIIHRLGYDSFNEFQTHLKDEVTHRLESPIRSYFMDKTGVAQKSDNCLDLNVPSIIQSLQTLYEQIDPVLLDRMAELMADSKKSLYVVGQRTSYGPAHYFYTSIKYIRPRVFLLGEENNSFVDQLLEFKKGDVALVISRRRYAKKTLMITEYLAEQGAEVILLTDRELTPLSGHAAYQIVVPSAAPPMYESACSFIALLETLLLSVARICDKARNAHSRKADDLNDRFGIYCIKRK